MPVCWNWLATDFFVRHGWTVTLSPDGTRTVTRADGLTLPIGRPCRHSADECPPHHTTTRREVTA